MGRKRKSNFSRLNNLKRNNSKSKSIIDSNTNTENSDIKYNEKTRTGSRYANKENKNSQSFIQSGDIWSNKENVFANKSICGNFNQGSISRFSFYAGKQCVPNSLVAIVYSKIMDVKNWNSSIMDKVLNLGNEYYIHLQTLPNIQHDYILINELHKSLELEGKHFELDICNEPQTGLIIDSEHNFGSTLHEAFINSLSIYDACFVTFKNNTFSVINDHERYFVFDSHSRNTHGMSVNDGTSVLLEFNDIMSVYLHCLRLSESMMCNKIEPFEITGINVNNFKIKDSKLVSSPIKNVTEIHSEISEIIKSNDIVITHVDENPFRFNPLSLIRKKELCNVINVPVVVNDSPKYQERCALTEPAKVVSIKGDGNCFFRSLSYSLTSTEDFHREIRLAVVNHIRTNSEVFTGLLQEQYNSINEYIKRSKMQFLGTWSTEFEILAAADLFQTDIYTYSNNRWLQFPVWRKNELYDTVGIYLNHKNLNHYEVVTDVKSNDRVCVDTDNSTTLGSVRSPLDSQKICRYKRKRGHNWSPTKIKRSLKQIEKIRHSNVENYCQSKSKKKYFNTCTKNKSREQTKYFNKKRKLLHKIYHKYKLQLKYNIMLESKLKKRYRVKLQSELKSKYEAQLKSKLKRKYQAKLKSILQEKYKEKIKPELKTKYRTQLKPKMELRYNTELKPKMELKYKSELKPKMELKYKSELKPKMELKYQSELKPKMELKYKSELKPKMELKYKSELKPKMELKYKSELKPKMKLKYKSELKPKMKLKYKSELKQKMELKYKKDLEIKLKRKYKSDLKAKLSDKYQSELKIKLVQKYKNELRCRILKKLKLKYQTDKQYRYKQKHKSISKNTNKVKKFNKKRKVIRENDMSNITNAIARFKKDTAFGPIYVCCVCSRLLFKNQVKECQREIYERKNKRVQTVAKKCININHFHVCNSNCLQDCSYSDNYKSLWICYSCHRKILKGKIPAESTVNNMEPAPLPPVIDCLNSLEKHLISKNIVFLKLINVSPQNDKKVIGEAVCVPSNLTEMTNVLPRCQNDDEIIRVKLKRKLANKSYYEFQTVTKSKIKNALSHLKIYNKYYHDVILNQEWIDEQDKEQHSANDAIELDDKSDKDNDSDSNNSDDLDDIDENIGRYTCDTLGSSCLQPVDVSSHILNNSDKVFSISPGENNRPIRVLMEKSNEACTFPYLFPDGKNTFSEIRDVRITLGKYLKNRLMSVDTRFASCSEYLFYAQYIYELQQILSGTSIALRQGRIGGNLITADMLTQDEPLQNILKSDTGYTFMKNCRGSPAFWQAAQKDLFAMIRQLGTPTFFVSFSCSELRFESFLSTILLQQGSNIKVSDLNWLQKRELLKSNPVTVARLFDHRFKLFLKKFLLSKANPIGKITDWFFRSEIQARGAIHIHGIVYVLDSPKLDIDTDEEVTSFIDKHITCALPDDKLDPELNEIVSNVQKHSTKHSKSCRKNKKVCRFNFPRPPSERTFICRTTDNNLSSDDPNEIIDKIDKTAEDKNNNISGEMARSILEAIWKELSSVDKSYKSLSDLYNELNISQFMFEKACEKLTNKTYIVLKRGINESWINQYNPNMLRAWNANLDIQYVTDAYACVVYIVSYITKAEREMGMFLRQTYKEAKQNNLDAKACMRKISTAYLHSREVSGPESALRILGLPLKQFSRKVQFIPTGKHNIKITLPIKVLQSRAKEGILNDNNMFMIGYVERYLNRPKGEPFDDMCIATVWSQYRVMSTSENPNVTSSKNPAFELQNDMGFIIKRTRTKPAIVRYARFSETKDPENYFLSSLQMFLPYRIDTQLKPPGFETYEEFYKSGIVKLSGKFVSVREIVESNRQCFQTDIDIDSIEETLAKCGDFEDAWARIAPETELDRIENEMFRDAINDSEADHDVQEPQIPDLLPSNNENKRISSETNIRGISKAEAIPLLRSLNNTQSQIFYKIRQYCLDKIHGKNPETLRLFITGSAGTGKSHLIKCIHYESSRILSKQLETLDDVTVLLTAPTGVSAFNIGASTIHSSFSIRKNFKLPYQPLGQETINTLRCKYRNLEIVIIDEISMVDHKLLCYIHGRLGQIKGTNSDELFGNVCIICFGDMWQLKPVKASSLCHDSVIDIWTGNFKLVELTEIMRQKDDLIFAQLLNRIRKRKKEDVMLQSDIDLLQSRVTNKDVDCLHIFSTNDQVNKYNSQMILEKCPDYIEIKALDYTKDARSGKMTLSNCCGKALDTPLVDLLTIGIGSKVMLVINLDVSAGLINGSFGKITFIQKDPNNVPVKIYVKFDNSKVRSNDAVHNLPPNVTPGSIAIERYESTHINYKGDVRRQFPLRLAYAVTVHKVQGLSLDKGVISLDRIFQAGQAYVALSRVKTLEGLTIQGFNEKVIYCDQRIESAINEMPRFLQNEVKSCPNDCNIVLFNIQGLTAHFEDVKDDKRFLQSDFICLTETWLKSVRISARIKLHDFAFYNQPRTHCYDDSDPLRFIKEKEHGGVGIYYKETMCHVIKLGILNIEYAAFTILDRNISVITIYRPPDYKLDLFIPNLKRLLTELQDACSSCIVMGDFNQNLFDRFNSIKSCFDDYGFTQVVTESTTEGNTCLDHVYLKGIDLNRVNITILPTYYSYHEAIKITLRR